MLRFIVYTRGRTGSSAICDELNNHPEITCHGEIYRSDPLARGPIKAAWEQYGRQYPKKINSRDRVLPLRLHAELSAEAEVTPEAFAAYYDYLATEAEAESSKAVGGKSLTNHLDQAELLRNCVRTGVSVVSLRRRNFLRQSVSAQVAQETGIYNRTRYQPEEGRKFTIDPKKVHSRIRAINKHYADLDEALAQAGVTCITVYYEDWLTDRAAFFTKMSAFLGVADALPENTVFSRTTPEPLSDLLEKYDEFVEGIRRAGFEEYLTE